MKQRILTGSVILLVFLGIMFLSFTVVYPIAMSVLAVMASFEVLRLFGLHKRLYIAIASYLVAAALPTVAYFMKGQELFYLQMLSLVLFAFLMYLFCVAVFEHGRMKFGDFAVSFVMVAYVVASFSSLSMIRYIDKVGIYCLVMIFVVAWLTDVFAYFTGSLIGKHKLAPDISPKKTIEGSIGGIVFATAFALLYGFVVESFTDISANYLVIALATPILSILSQFGDLIASLIKREYGAKDYGNLLPGHGGIMDRFDSIIAVSIATTVISLALKPFM